MKPLLLALLITAGAAFVTTHALHEMVADAFIAASEAAKGL